MRSEGSLFELSIKHLPYSPEPLEVQVRDAVELLIDEQHSGDILVFLPGAAEIRRAMRECESRRAPGRIAGAAAAWQSAAQGAGSRALARSATKTHPGHECRGELGDGRGRHCGHRQRTGALCDLFSVERVADAARRPGEQGFGEAKSRTGGAHRARAACCASTRRRITCAARSRTRRRSCAATYRSFASICERCGLPTSTTWTGWMRRP